MNQTFDLNRMGFAEMAENELLCVDGGSFLSFVGGIIGGAIGAVVGFIADGPAGAVVGAMFGFGLGMMIDNLQ